MAEAEHFVDEHQLELIKRVSNVAPILDELLSRKLISQKTYDKIGALHTTQEKMRALCSTCLKAGTACKDVFYKILEENEPHLINDLKGKKDENVLEEVQVETMTAKKKLSETLNDLSSEELEEFKSLIELEKSFPLFSRRQQKVTNTEDVVELMVETYRQECVELTKKVLKKMNRTDLVQRFSDIGSGTKEKQQPSLIQRVETMTSVIELLLETLKDLSDRELEMFKEALPRSLHFDTCYSDFQLKQLMRTADMQDTVFLMVQHYRQKSVDMIKKVLKKMRRTDLVQRLSDSSSGLQKKQSVDEHLSALIHKVATMAAVKELLLETFSDLSYEELKNLKWFLQFTFFQRSLPQTSWEKLLWTDRTDWTDVLVDVMMEKCGQQSVEVMREIFMDMNRTDLVQRLSESSSGPKEKHSVDEHWPALIQEVETLTSVTELLLETMKDLSGWELKTFKEMSETLYHIRYSDTSWMLQETRDKQDTVFFMVQTFGQQSVEKIKEVLEMMKRTDLVQRLSNSSSGFKNEQRSALIQRVTTIAAVKQLLLETMNDLRNKELKKFKRFLQLILSQKELKDISWMMEEDTAQMVDVMVQTFGRQSVDLTREVYMNMNRTDLVQRLSKSSSELKDKHSADEYRRARFERNAATRAVKQIILETLKNLSHKEFKKFKMFLQFTCFQRSLPQIEWSALEWAESFDVVDLMVQTCGQQSVQVTEEIFMDMNRTDLLQRLSGASSGLKEKHLMAEQQSSLIQRVETMTSVIELLLETLKDLSDRELETFNEGLPNSLHFPTRDSDFQLKQLMRTADMQDTVFLMVQHYGQKSVNMTKKVLKKMRRTDLVQRLSDSSSGLQKKQSVDEHLSALIHKVATMAAVKELLLETFSDLSYEELKNLKWFLQFTFFQRNLPQTSWRRLQWTDRTDWTDVLVDEMMEKCGQQSVEVMREIFMDMNRTDLVQRLSESSSGPKEKHSVDEHWPALIQEVETLTSVTELLLETMKDLSGGELQEFKEFVLCETLYHIRHSGTTWMLQETRDKQDTVFFMVQTFGQQSVEKIKEVLKKMNRTDLVQRLSDSSSGFKNEQRSALIQRVATIAAVKQLLLETLKDLKYEELEDFRWFLQLIVSQKELKDISWMMEEDRVQMVDVMVQTFGRQSVDLTREVYMNMNRTDLVQRLSKSSSELKDKHSADEYQRARFEREAVEEILQETLRDLSNNEIEKFKRLLPFTYFQRSLPQISLRQSGWGEVVPLLVDVMVQTCDQQSVEVTQEVLRDMNRTDLLQRLSETSSRLKGSKFLPEIKGWGGFSSSSEEHQPKPIQTEVTMTPLQEKLFETLEDLSFWEFELFKKVLQKTNRTKGLPRIPGHRLELAGRVEIMKLMEEIYGQQSVEVTREILNEMNRSDLVQRLSDISSESEGASRSLELGGCGGIKQDTSDWTKLEPEVNSPDEDEAPTYSLQSETGSFECSISGLRWTNKEKVSFKYQFCSWEEPMERMENLQYMPAGPLMDITVTAGRLDEVYLPHWICIDDNPKISDSFAVLHIDDCGDVVEKVSEVTPSHVKLSEPIFSPRAALMKAGFPVKIKCKMLIYYKPNTPFLKLHVYLIPRDPALQQTVDTKKSSKGYEIIEKSHPDKYLKMQKGFTLTADISTAKILPKVITLRYDCQDPNFYEVFIENPDRDFHLKLSQTNKGEPQGEPVWICEIRKDDYQTSAHSEAAESSAPPCYGATARVEHFVDKHQCDLIERVNNIEPILDNLLRDGVIQQEGYDTICAMKTPQEKMRKLYSGPLKAGGLAAKDVFYKILEKKESYLVADLKRKES